MLIHNGAGVSPVDTEPQLTDSPSSSPTPPPAQSGGSQPGPTQSDRHDPTPAAPAASNPIDNLQPTISVIGADLAISGQDVHVISKGKIRVEGKIQGDVLGTEVVIGDVGTVEGVVSGDTVRVFGAIMGAIRGVQVEIEAGAKVEADVHHHTLSVDAQAQIEGRVHRARDIAELKGSAQDVRDDAAQTLTDAPQQAAAHNPRKGRLWR